MVWCGDRCVEFTACGETSEYSSHIESLLQNKIDFTYFPWIYFVLVNTEEFIIPSKAVFKSKRKNSFHIFFFMSFFQGESNFSSFKLNSQRNSIPYKYKIFSISKQKCCRKLYLKLYYTNSFKFILQYVFELIS